MMEKRKNPEVDLRRYSGLFFQIGLLTALLLTVSAFEWRTQKEVPFIEVPDKGESTLIDIIPTKHEEPKKPPKPVIPRKITVAEVDPEEKIEFTLDTDDIVVETDPEILPDLKDEEVDIYVGYVDQRPSPVGGERAFYEYVSKNIRYTREARNLGIEGKVFVQFVVDEEGNLSQVTVVKGVGAGLDEEARRVIENAPAWNPGRQDGRRVKVRMIIPIIFKLN